MKLNDDKRFGIGKAYFLNPTTGERTEIGQITAVNFAGNATVEDESQQFIVPKTLSIRLQFRLSAWQMFNWMTRVIWRRTE